MIKISDLLSYIPAKHEEHGVDATLHVLCSTGEPLHEVFSNPPGGSWTQFDVIKPGTNITYRWDHIPRAPSADVKRPDLVLQLNEGDKMSFLSIESKLDASSAEIDMPIRLARYLTGTDRFTGIMQRPAWHKLEGKTTIPEVLEGVSPASMQWEILPPDASREDRFWLNDYPREKIKFWSGFAYALNPETYSELENVNKDEIVIQIESIHKKHPDLDVIIAVGWAGEFQFPFIIRKYSKEFLSSIFAIGLDKHLEEVLFIKNR